MAELPCYGKRPFAPLGAIQREGPLGSPQEWLRNGYRFANRRARASRPRRFSTKVQLVRRGGIGAFLQMADSRADDDWRELFKDPHDGRLDTSQWLLERRGFLPVPVIISSPSRQSDMAEA